MRTEELSRSVQNETNPLRTPAYFIGAFIVVWAIIIAAIFAANWLMELMMK